MIAEEELVRLALKEARKGWGGTHPNPMVGAVIVEGGQVVATGYHKAAGEAHAEVDALRTLGRKPGAGAAMYVTLEPCCTHGRTPPCTRAILESGIRVVRVGALDPNPDVAGKGVALLRDDGVDVAHGILEEECRDLNMVYNHWITEKSPLVAAKVATTLDGHIATRGGHSQWITSGPAREDVMRWRRLFPAIGVGSETALKDNPQLTSRISGQPVHCGRRFVFDTRLRTANAGLRLFGDDFSARTTLVTTRETPQPGAWILPADKNGRPCLDAFRKQCAQEGITGVFIEGGSGLLASFINFKQLDYLFAYRAPKILADPLAKPAFTGMAPETLDNALELYRVKHASLGDDQLMRGFIKK